MTTEVGAIAQNNDNKQMKNAVVQTANCFAHQHRKEDPIFFYWKVTTHYGERAFQEWLRFASDDDLLEERLEDAGLDLRFLYHHPGDYLDMVHECLFTEYGYDYEYGRCPKHSSADLPFDVWNGQSVELDQVHFHPNEIPKDLFVEPGDDASKLNSLEGFDLGELN